MVGTVTDVIIYGVCAVCSGSLRAGEAVDILYTLYSIRIRAAGVQARCNPNGAIEFVLNVCAKACFTRASGSIGLLVDAAMCVSTSLQIHSSKTAADGIKKKKKLFVPLPLTFSTFFDGFFCWGLKKNNILFVFYNIQSAPGNIYIIRIREDEMKWMHRRLYICMKNIKISRHISCFIEQVPEELASV